MSRPTRDTNRSFLSFGYRAITYYGSAFPCRIHLLLKVPSMVPQPQCHFWPWFRLFPVRSPLLGESRLISFPPVTEMFQFAGFASTPYVFRCRYSIRSGFPHSDISGSKLFWQLPEAFRSHIRPSSPPPAKASTTSS